jgi:hypothetical protein
VLVDLSSLKTYDRDVKKEGDVKPHEKAIVTSMEGV